MEPSMRILHASLRTKHIDVKHNLARDACDARKVGVVYVRTEDQHSLNR